jgi:2',3'-cyclic-nucleotide 2'-phosphodiesterase (5'-nucleotidase family)
MTGLTRRQTLASLLAGGAAAFAREAQAADAVAKMTFLLVNDVYEINEGPLKRGGFPRLATVVAAERARAAEAERRLVFVHAGDTLSPSLMSGFDQGAHMVALFNRLGLDIFVPGNHEFDFGPAVYHDRVGEASFKILAANMRDTAGQRLPGHGDDWTLVVDGVTIAMIGSAYDATAGVSHSDGIVFAPTVQTIQDKAKAARAGGADFVVAIIHADKLAGAAIMNSHAADLILSGHNHDLHIDFDGRTAFAESSQDAFFVTAIDLDIALTKTDGARKIAWWPTYRITDTATVAPDPAMVAVVKDYQATLAKTLDVPVATLAAPLDSRKDVVRTKEAAIGDFFADAVRARTGADLAILNGGGIRGDTTYEKGAIFTARDVLTELPFGNKTVVTAVTGQAIRAALENGLQFADAPSGRFPQVSGLVVTAALAAPKGKRVESVTIGGAPLDPAKTYKVATNDFMARGGDGYAMLAGETKVTIDTGDALVAQTVMDYAKQVKVIDAKADGRIVLK